MSTAVESSMPMVEFKGARDIKDSMSLQFLDPSVRAVSFHNIEYEVSTMCGRRHKKILHGVSGYLTQGVNAIMGPTGSGKTSLLDILAGRKSTSGLSGTLLVNGDRQPNNFKCLAGYVVQDDVVMGTLTVRENLHFSAALRLPSSTSRTERKRRVEKVIKELGIQLCADTKVGTEFIRGISGGERKRTNIGMELIIEPTVLFLDEPTTGLDANTAVSVLQKLKTLSMERECIVVMSIHQPRYSIFKLFDTLTLLSQGSMIYHGPAKKALTYFDSIGFPCEEHENPADFFLDVIIQCEKSSLPGPELVEDTESGKVVSKDDLEDFYRKSEQHHIVQEKLEGIMSELLAKEKGGKRIVAARVSYATNIFWQLFFVCLRSIKNLVRNPMTSVIQVVVMIIFGLLVGFLYLRLNFNTFNSQTVINDRIGALFFITMNQVFSNLSAVEVFIKQKALFIHENVSGFYRVSAFFVAKVFSDMIPMRLFPLIFYVLITYFMVGFQLDAAKFFIYTLTLGLVSMTASSLAFAISARFSVTAIANLLIAMLFVLSMLFGGFLVSLNSLPVWLQWMKYLSLFRYSIEALSINEIAGQCYFDSYNVTGKAWSTYPCEAYLNLTGLTSCDLPVCVNGTDALLSRGYEVDPNWVWYDHLGLLCLILVFLTLTYINLRTVKKLK